jgi:DNA-binding transcriptional LysR family regulator
MRQPQPTISLALRRLRSIFDDPLLVRDGNRLIPTERGRELKVSSQRILDEIDRQLAPSAPFDPAAAGHHFKLLIASCFGATFLPRIIRRMRQEAPLATVDVCPMPPFASITPLIADGLVDIALGNWPQPPDNLRTAPLFSSDFVCLVHGRHPLAGMQRLTMAHYLGAHHLSLTLSTNSAMSPIDSRLAELNVRRRIAVSVPEYSGVPYVLAQTDLMFTTSRHFAEHLASIMPLSVIEAPAGLGAMTFYALWHERNHRSRGHRWLRQLIKDVACEAEAGSLSALPPLIEAG